MAGEVWAESPADPKRQRGAFKERFSTANIGPGSIFHFTCWIEKSTTKAEDKVARASLSGRKVLVVDDNRANLNILKYMLETVGMRVVCLQDGNDVVSALLEANTAKDPFDIAVVDILLGEMTGFDVVERVRQQSPSIAGIPLLAFSSSLEKNAKECRDFGFDGFLPKPIRRKRFHQMLERLLSPSRKEDETHSGKPSGEIHTQYSIREEMKHSVCILLAEDNPMNQKLAVLLLSKAGYTVEVANNGKETLEKYVASPGQYDLIFMDVQMPEMDGIACTQAIRDAEERMQSTDASLHHIPIIAMTANVMKGDKELYLEAGMDDYVAKPIKREIVFEMVEKWILRDGSH
jgi:CheY-like chemotaxis protein